MKHRGHIASSSRGTVMALVALSLVALLAMAALVVDLGILYLAGIQAQNAADMAALAAVGRLRLGMDQAAATQAATATAAANSILREPVTLGTGDVQIGAWDSVHQQVTGWDATATQVAARVTVRRTSGSPDGPIPTYFARVMGIQSMQITRSAIALVSVNMRPRNSVSVMLVQDGSSSFQEAWSQAIDADTEFLKLVNGVSVTGDKAGMVTFNASLTKSYLQQIGLWNSYKNYPQANLGIKYTTNSSGTLRKTNAQGQTSSSGQIRPMTGVLTDFDTANHTQLVTAMDNASQLLNNGIAWGDTDTAAGLNYAIDALVAGGGGGDKVIVLISDGMPHDVRGAYYTELRKEAAIAAADRAEGLGIRIHTVTLEGTNGANYDFNEGLIRNGGYALRAADASRLRDILITVGTLTVGHSYLLK